MKLMQILAVLVLLVPSARADEGMWTFDNPPNELMQERYGFEVTPEWSRHAMLASLRFNDGGSGSFVSDRGLVLTNHHVAFGQLQKMSTPKRNYVKDGFYAKKPKEEISCPDLEINQLRSFENVTERVVAAIQGDSDAERNKKRKAEIARIEKDCTEETGLRCDVVTLYQGGEYWLYRYKKYTDIRLVMAPEVTAAFFGGDFDNFTYPRFALDYAFFRVYEDGKPVRPERYFRWSESGAKEGEITFVTGHPGRTARQRTVAQLRLSRDVSLPFALKSAKRRIEVLKEYMARGPEEARRAKGSRFGIENYLKARTGMFEGLLNPKVFNKKVDEEKHLRAAVDKDPKLKKEFGKAWDRLARTARMLEERSPRRGLISGRSYRAHHLSRWAETIVLYAREKEKPNGERYREFRDSNLESLNFRLFSKAPSYPDLDEVLLAGKLAEYRDVLGPDDPFVRDILNGNEPAELAKDVMEGTRVGDPEFRRKLVEGGVEAVERSMDPLIAMALRIEPHYRKSRDWYEDEIESVERIAGLQIAKARFTLYGKKIYPDATFTLRMSYGAPKRYIVGTTVVPYYTVLGGLYARADSFANEKPFDLSPRVAKARKKVDFSVPVDFVTTHDITGGNSGSPVINKALELVGLIFDGNIQSLSNEYVYSDAVARAVSVHSSGILHSLEKIYRMKKLVGEIQKAAKL
ncbi:MAG: S46 family peptidase [Elusimicrobiota bacterium]